MTDHIVHYGMPRRSGRYPWGSGDNPYQRDSLFMKTVDELKSKGWTDNDIARDLGISTTQLRSIRSYVKDQQRMADAAQALRLKEKGYSNVAIGERMGINESSVRSLLDPSKNVRASETANCVKMLKESLDSKGYIDVGVGSERYLGISRTKLKTAIDVLKAEGYEVFYIPVEQVGTGKKTSIMTLCKPGTEYSEVFQSKDQISMVTDYFTDDGGKTYNKIQPPVSVKSDRLEVYYDEDGGSKKDGVIELRRGVDDISLGDAQYAQVRIAIDGTHYLKGMAVYSDDLPPGIDIRFNTNKKKGTPLGDTLKKLKDDPDNPFGSSIKEAGELLLAQRYYIDKNGKKQQSALNIVNEEGDWGRWSKSLSSQVLSKQPLQLARTQLKIAFGNKLEEFEAINKLTNPVIKKRLMSAFADDCDSSAVHLKAAAMPRQTNSVIIPINSLKDNEVYAPNYPNGTRLVLIRHPHGGKFEIPELVVNNKNKEGSNVLGKNPPDAIGINHKVAQRLSGADFDGDTVLVIPNNNKRMKTSSPLKGLADFDPQAAYPAYKGMLKMKPRTKQVEMGKVSNLITDMTIKGASESELARAVRHSMVVIDAEKHNLNYRQSAIDNDITGLKKKYQFDPVTQKTGGASTLVSRASSETRVPKRSDTYKIDPKTGKKIFTYDNSTYTDAKGNVKTRTTSSTKMYEVSDARKLSSGTAMENEYATYANNMKALGDRSRLVVSSTPNLKYSPTAKKTYETQVNSLNAKLNVALKNAPLERQAQILANTRIKAKTKDLPSLDNDDLKKIKSQELTRARQTTGASKQQIYISDKEWNAIQAGAISNNKLTQIINNSNLDRVKELATPRTQTTMTSSKIARAKALQASGYTQAEIAKSLGVSASTVNKALN